MPRKIFYITLFLLVLPFYSFANSLFDQIEISTSDERGITFTLNLEDPRIIVQPVQDAPGSYFLSGTILLGIPVDAEPVLVSVRGSNPLDLSGLSGDILQSGNSLAELGQTKMLRGRKIVAVKLNPYSGPTAYANLEISLDFISSGIREGNPVSAGGNDPYDNILRNALLNYAQVRNWPILKSPAAFKAGASEFTQSSDWYRVFIGNEGFCIITGQELNDAGITINSLSSDAIRVFYGGGMPLPPENDIVVPEFHEISVMIKDGGDGQFDNNDTLLFFAEGADRWLYPADSTPAYLENHYVQENVYWLTTSGSFASAAKRIATISGTPSVSPDTIVTEGNFVIQAGQNNVLYVDNNLRVFDYYNWYWSDDSRLMIRLWMPQAIIGDTARIKLRARSGFDVEIRVNNNTADRLSVLRNIYEFDSDDLVNSWNNFYVLLDEATSLPTYVDYLQVYYRGTLIPDDNRVDFYVDSLAGEAEFIIDESAGFDSMPLVFNMADADNPINVNPVVEGGEIHFAHDFGTGGSSRFYAASLTTAFAPDSMVGTTVQDISGNLSRTDLYIVAPDRFIDPMAEYESYREDKSGIDISRVSLEQIVYNYSYGLYDPVAIRNFLKDAYLNGPAPAPGAVLLIGDGTYDFENNLETATINYCPPYVQPLDSSSSDDNYVYFGEYGLLDSDTTWPGDRGFDMMAARWPVKSTNDIATIINKIKNYESSTSFGPWHRTMTFVADDEFGAFETEWIHTSQTEELIQPPRVPAEFTRNKIYLWEYPFDSNREKPTVNEEIVRSINEGTLLINYVGHGNPDTWAHEHVFNRNTDLPLLHNTEKLPLVSTFSCSIGFFDNPTLEGMAEDLLRYSGGGAIAVVSATRLVYSTDNAELNQGFFDVLFGSDSLSVCEALYLSKIMRQYSGGDPQTVRNDRNYAFFGDPYLKLRVPTYEIKITDRPDSLLALDRHTVSGEVVDKISGAHVALDGSVELFVYDSDKQKSYTVVNSGGDPVRTIDYALDGPIIYRGNASITDGYFDFSFIAPLDIGYGGSSAQISSYGYSEYYDALGLADSIPVSSAIKTVSDDSGPEIQVMFGGNGSFISGDRVASGETLNLIISDSSGINLTGSLGHGITLVIDEQVENTVNLTELFQYDEGSFTVGRIDYEMQELAPGVHTFKAKAWDNANNSSVVEFDVDISEAGGMMIADLMNYPNPMSERTMFSFSLTSPASTVKLELFTLSGKKIKYYREDAVPSGYVEFYSWDGRDADSDRVATGVYIYKLTAVSEDHSETAESFGKIIVLN